MRDNFLAAGSNTQPLNGKELSCDQLFRQYGAAISDNEGKIPAKLKLGGLTRRQLNNAQINSFSFFLVALFDKPF